MIDPFYYLCLNVNGESLWKYIIIPFTSGSVGWFTNVLALHMTFYPLEYKGINWMRWDDQPMGLFGWQGVIPTKAGKMAGICFELMENKLLDVHEVFNRLDPMKFSEVMEQGILLLMDSIVNETANEYMSSGWNQLPDEVKDEIVVMADKESPKFLKEFMADLQTHITDVLDIKHMTVTACVKNKELINKIFMECGEKEFICIKRCGFWFGFLFGLFQMTVYFFYRGSWILPVCGFVTGWLTNYLALKIIFRPLKPIQVGPFVIQGLFLKRQKEVSSIFARVNCMEMLHPKVMWEAILTGPYKDRFFATLRAHTIVFTENLLGGLKPFAIAGMGAHRFAAMKEDVASKVMQKLPTIIDQSYEYTNEALDMENTIRVNMQGLTPEEFEGVLHPAFQEDELTLIMVNAVVGLLVGIFQVFVIFGV